MDRQPGSHVSVVMFLLAAAPLVALLGAPLAVHGYWLFFTSQMVAATYLALSFNLAYSYGKVLSFAQGTFFAFGAYATAHLATADPWGLPLALTAAVFGAGVLGALIGAALVRMDSHNATIASVIIATVGLLIGNAARDLTGGEDGIRLMSAAVGAGSFTLPTGVNGASYYLAALPLATVFLGMWLAQKSRWWTVLRAIADNEKRAQQLGFNVQLRRLGAFAVSAAVAGLGGAFYALMMRHVTTSVLDIALSVNAILWAVVGGLGTAFGPLLGVFFVYPFTEVAASIFLYVEILVGTLLLVVALVFSGGIMGTLESVAEERRMGGTRGTPKGRQTDASPAPN